MILSGRGGVGSSSGRVGNGGGCKFPFTPSQWQELEHQALIFKYMVSGVPIPPDLLFTLRRSFLDSTSTSPHMGWSCFQMGLGLGMRKIDPEPGRCRRTDGKKWRCSKEAFQESKYCEKHMHRGKNRSRKHVEQPQQQQQLHLQQVLASSSSMVKPTKHYTSSLSSSVTSDHHHNSNRLFPSSYYSNTHPYHHSTELGLHSCVDPRVVDENGHSLMNGDSWGLSPLKTSSANDGRMISTKEHNQQEYPPYFQLQRIEDYESSRTYDDDDGGDYDDNGRTSRTRREKTVYRFLEECPPDNHNNNSNKESASWLNLDDNKSSKFSSSSTTQLSISIPTTTTSTTSHHHHQLFPMFNSTHQTNF